MKLLFTLTVNFIFCLSMYAQLCTKGATGAVPADGEYVLVWADEFDNNGEVCSDNWHHQTQLIAGDSWANGEVQHYTDRIENSYVEEGFLNIVAKREDYNDQGVTKNFTSARLNSKFAFTYGRVDVRAKLPSGNGTWPAIWTLGQNINEDGGFWDDNIDEVNWPACGEIDIMEHWGNNPNVIHGSLHTPSSFGATVNTQTIVANEVSSTFHVYSIVWDENAIQFLLDGVPFYTYNPATKNDATWPFDKPQYLLLNIAMGGIGGAIDPGFTESTMEIDYVRVFQNYDEDANDNLPVPLVSAPEPTEDEEEVLSIFSDSYTDLTDVVYTNPEKEVYSDVVNIQENAALRYLDVNEQLIDLSANIQDVSNQDYFHFDYWTPNSNELSLVFKDQSGNESSHTISIGLENWQGVDIAIADIQENVNLSTLEKIQFSGNGVVYFDNLFFFIDPNDDVPDPVAQTITFATVPDISIDEGSFELEATASSGLAVEYSTFSTELNIEGSTVNLLKPGTVVVTAEQPGNEEFLAAEPVTQLFCVNPSKPIISQTEFGGNIWLQSNSEVGNKWYLNGNIISSGNPTEIEVNENGIYTLKVTIDGCDSPFSDEFPLLITSTAPNNNLQIRVYPNPVTDVIKIENVNEIESVILTDVMGRAMPITFNQDKNVLDANISTLPTGIYYLVLESKKEKHITRLMKH
ncbi:MAG: family 16 glycosylhydrolase [Fulvivirga sp.]|uniref:family 16 glycosylhydrolase n=1 Tax=Fulvivirga sp. TaxID=1931237 RepID=UPI0032EEDFAB